MTATMASLVDELLAATVSDEPRSMKAEHRDRSLLSAAVAFRAFTIREVARSAGNTHWYGDASRLFRILRTDGRLRIVSPDGAKPYVYEWVSGPDDLEALRSATEPSPSLVDALEAEVDRLRALAGEPPLRPREARAS